MNNCASDSMLGVRFLGKWLNTIAVVLYSVSMGHSIRWKQTAYLAFVVFHSKDFPHIL